MKQNADKAWADVRDTYHVSEAVCQQLRRYCHMLEEWNERCNVTAIVSEDDMARLHIYDALALSRAHDMTKVTTLVDVGSGGGVPGIPLKIVFPHISVTLVEVKQKKVAALRDMCDRLGLRGITVCERDWRTHLRHATQPVDLVCARASLSVPELLRMFRPASAYRKSRLVYWAADTWQPVYKEGVAITDMYTYEVAERQRHLVTYARS